tara:strand:- start:2442 stop:2714 length:273 start_codon:yes stop_codon:yes gene_type:complete
MKKIKNYFSPVVGGHYDGYPFKEFLFSMQRLGLLSFAVGMLLAVIIGKDYFPEEESGFTFAVIFASSLIALVLYKGIFQHWSDMKNHTSR